jgi:hypothetical protein
MAYGVRTERAWEHALNSAIIAIIGSKAQDELERVSPRRQFGTFALLILLVHFAGL